MFEMLSKRYEKVRGGAWDGGREYERGEGFLAIRCRREKKAIGKRGATQLATLYARGGVAKIYFEVGG